MARNGSGTYSLPEAAFVSGTVISSTAVNSDLSDIANALTASIAKDGQTTPTANLPMGTYAHTGVGNASARTMYAAAGQVQDSAFTWCGTAGGTADALTLTPTPAITAYAAGQRFTFKAGASPNTGAATVAVSGLTAKDIQAAGSALAANAILAGREYEVLYDGTQFQLSAWAGGVAAASETVAGIIEIATAAETTTGTDDTRAITPLKLTTFAPATATPDTGADSVIFLDATDSKIKKGTFPAAGKILQVVQATKTDTTSTASTSFADVSGMSVAITPSSASSRVFVFAMMSFGTNPATYAGHIKVLRDSTDVLVGDAAGSRTQATVANGQSVNNTATAASILVVDSPATTSAITYKIQWAVESGGTLYLNRSTTDTNSATGGRYASTIIVMEIGP